MKRSVAVALLLAIATGCAGAADLSIRLDGPVVNRHLPSGSGITSRAGKYFVVGDDSNYLFTLNRKFEITDRAVLQAGGGQVNGRIPKDIKPDYEAMAMVTWAGTVWNLILGSGSKQGTRESGLLVASDGKSAAHSRDMAVLYRGFAALAAIDPGQGVNIEALAIAHGDAYFFNRGNANRNIVFKVPLKELMDYMTGRSDRIADIALHEVRLPRLEGIEAGFSGADYWPEIDSLVFSASVERTGNSIDDGAVLGSYLGLIRRSALKAGAPLDLTQSAQRLAKSGAPLRTKVESIVLTRTQRHRASGALVSDNDDGRSEFFGVVLTLKSAPPR